MDKSVAEEELELVIVTLTELEGLLRSEIEDEATIELVESEIATVEEGLVLSVPLLGGASWLLSLSCPFSLGFFTSSLSTTFL